MLIKMFIIVHVRGELVRVTFGGVFMYCSLFSLQLEGKEAKRVPLFSLHLQFKEKNMVLEANM